MPIGTIVLTPDANFSGGALSQFAAVAVFGDGVNPITVGAKVQIPLPFAGSFDATYARLHTSGDVTFAVALSSGIAAAVAGVGGTAPSVTAALGVADTTLDWTTTTFAEGDVLEITLVSISGSVGAALAIRGVRS